METAQLLVIAQAKDEASAILGKMEGSIGGLGKAAMIGFAAVGTAAVAAGAALFKIGADFDDAYDSIRIATGKTGEALEGLKGDMKAVMTDIPTDMKSASAAIGDLSTRLGLTGPPLQDMAKQFLELSRITGTEVSENVRLMTRVFGDWGVTTEDQSSTMDLLFRATQETGIGLGELQAKVVQFGAPLRAMGFSLNESVAMLGKWEKEGVNSELVLGSLRIAMGNFAEAGVPMRKGLMDTVAQIQKLGPSAEATSLAMKTFGARAGPDMAAAILEGRFAYEDLLTAIKGGSDTIMGVGKDTMDAAEKFDILKNRAMVLIEPLASGLFGALSNLADMFLEAGPAIGEFMVFLQPVGDLVSKVAETFITFGKYLAEVAGFGDSLNDFLADMPPFLVPIVKVIGDVVAGVRDLLPMLGAFADALGRILSGKADWGAFTQVLKDFFGPEAQAMGEKIIGTFQSIAKVIGDVLGPVFKTFSNAVGTFLSQESNLKAVLAGIGGALGILIGGAILAGIVALGAAMWGLATAVIAATWPILAIAAAIAAGILIWQNWDKIAAVLEQALKDFGNLLLGPFKTAWEDIGRTMDTVGATFNEAWENLKTAVSTGLSNLVKKIEEWVASFLKQFQDAWDGISGAFSTWWASEKGLPGALKAGLKALVEFVTEWWPSFAKPYQDAWDFISEIFGNFIGGAGSILGMMGEGLGALLSKVGEWITPIGTKFQEAWDGVSTVFGSFLGPGGQAGGSLFETLGSGLTNFVTAVQDWMEDFLQPYRDTWQKLQDEVFGPALTNLWNSLTQGLENLITLAQGWIARFVKPFQEAWDNIKGMFDWLIGRSVIPDLLEEGLDRMLRMVTRFGEDFASAMGDAARSGVFEFQGAMAGFGWPTAPKLSDEQIAQIMLEKMPNLKKIMEEAGKGGLSPLEMIKDWATWKTPAGESVLEGFGSWQEFAAGKGWLPTAPTGPSVMPSNKALMQLFEQFRPFATSTEEAAQSAVEAMAAQIKEATGGKVVPALADMQKWWNQIMGQYLTGLVNAPFEPPPVVLPKPPTTTTKPPTTTPTAPTAPTPVGVGGLSLSPSISTMMALYNDFAKRFPLVEINDLITKVVDTMKFRIISLTSGAVMPSGDDIKKWWDQISNYLLNQQLNAPPTIPPTTTTPSPVSATTTAPPPVPTQTITVNLTGLFLAPDRTIAQELARILAPELAALVTTR